MVAYRILDVGILIKMFKEKKNYLSSPQNWQDQWEKLDIKLSDKNNTRKFKRLRRKIFSQCWSREGYSWALWKINSPYGYGVRIETQMEKIYQSLPLEVRNNYNQNEIIKKVKYLKETLLVKRIKDIIEKDGINLKSLMKMFFLKRRAFEFENETRLILPRLLRYSEFNEESLGDKNYLSYVCDPCKYVENICFDSNINKYVYDVFKSRFKDFGFTGKIYRSRIDKKPKKIQIK